MRIHPGGLALSGLAALTMTLGLMTASPASAALQGANGALTRAPWLTDLTQSSVQVSWATNAQYTGVVEYGPPGSCTANSVIAGNMGSPITVNGVTEYQNSVTVTGLSASTTYCYRITNTGSNQLDLLGSNPSPQFTTLETATDTQPLTFDVLGDWGDTTNSGVRGCSTPTRQGWTLRSPPAAPSSPSPPATSPTRAGPRRTTGTSTRPALNISAVFGPSYWAVPGETTPLYVVSGNHGLNSTFITNMPEQASAAGRRGVFDDSLSLDRRHQPRPPIPPPITRSAPAESGSICSTPPGLTATPERRRAAVAVPLARCIRSTTMLTGPRRRLSTSGWPATSPLIRAG